MLKLIFHHLDRKMKTKTITELVRRKEGFGEDPYIFTRRKRLSTIESDLCEQFGLLKERELGKIIQQNLLIPSNVTLYVIEGYGGNYVSYYFSDNKRAQSYDVAALLLNSFPRATEQNEIQNIATLVAQDLENITNGRLNGKIRGVEGKHCEPNCGDKYRTVHFLFCGVSLHFEEDCKELYNIIRAYTSNLTEGVKSL